MVAAPDGKQVIKFKTQESWGFAPLPEAIFKLITEGSEDKVQIVHTAGPSKKSTTIKVPNGTYLFHPGWSHRPSAFCVFHGKIGSEGHSERGANMLIHLHEQATTTPKVRAAIQASTEPASALAERFGTTEQTV